MGNKNIEWSHNLFLADEETAFLVMVQNFNEISDFEKGQVMAIYTDRTLPGARGNDNARGIKTDINRLKQLLAGGIGKKRYDKELFAEHVKSIGALAAVVARAKRAVRGDRSFLGKSS